MGRKKYPVEQKLKIVQECLETGNCAVVAGRYGLSSSMVNRWTGRGIIAAMEKWPLQGIAAKPQVVAIPPTPCQYNGKKLYLNP